MPKAHFVICDVHDFSVAVRFIVSSLIAFMLIFVWYIYGLVPGALLGGIFSITDRTGAFNAQMTFPRNLKRSVKSFKIHGFVWWLEDWLLLHFPSLCLLSRHMEIET